MILRFPFSHRSGKKATAMPDEKLSVPAGKTLAATVVRCAVWLLVAGLLDATRYLPDQSHHWARWGTAVSAAELLALFACIPATVNFILAITLWRISARGKPAVEAAMLGRIYGLCGILATVALGCHAMGYLEGMAAFLAMFGGMLLGWSLQAPVSGAAAWLLVCLKRPFRPGDRVQFPNLELTGDIKAIDMMYTVLDQVGGSVGSEEAVGRYILVPNAMLFSQVVINYTVLQNAPFILDEVVVRITYDSNWKDAEELLLKAARRVTDDIIRATGVEPYIRSDLDDYGVLMRLRYNTRVKRRAEVSYLIHKVVFEEIQRNPNVDIAIPYVYSYRNMSEGTRSTQPPPMPESVVNLDIAKIRFGEQPISDEAVDDLVLKVQRHGLLQPIMVMKRPDADHYDIVAGHLRLAACQRLGWKEVPAIIHAVAEPVEDTSEGD